jgi:hypothetical protein
MEGEKKPERTEEKKPEKTKDLERLTTTKLRELALEKYPQIKGVHGMKKEELAEAIKALEVELGIREKEEEKKAPHPEIKKKVKKEEKKLLTISEAKGMVKKLKAQRGGALSSEDRKALKEARREIKKLKRLMRRLKEAS